ncbi:tRNA1(Val) (adenine(37)-N6)-methyltransferase [[Mycoplasma] mobile]|uniref:O-methyltransferase putative nucleic acid modification enzyme n=1 Tax=Mycoplasma mobile (strain ATCC 43663 / 163K / NCTC 11711) TaxID=267748 RepID=Q6KI59_MYCM1|nr:tRNA1(Val) (adenine(37)-N6)-methyltransferase [[Mycoplasma] mobile]AAT27717.1 O-methyltransferase putative nucleic acid modification enzyme [Mycoplasma mobile 163K]
MILKVKKTWEKNSLGFDSNLFIYQDKTMFNYSVDTILLGNFCSINSKTKSILEIGTNNAALAIFVSERNKNIKIDAIELQKKAIHLANFNVIMNSKEEQISIIHANFNSFWKKHNKNQAKKYDSIICNPPFYQIGKRQLKNVSKEKLIATYDLKLNFDQLIKGASKIIKQKGYFSVVIPTERSIDFFTILRKYDFEPKKVQFIHPRINQKSNLVLIESRYKTGWGTNFLENIYLHPEDEQNHEYLPNVKSLYKPIKF